MRTINILLIAVIVMFLSGCGGGSKKQSLAPEKPEEEIEEAGSVTNAELVLDTIIPKPGIKYKELRTINSSKPPVVLNLSKNDYEEKDIDLADYYSKVKFVKLKHPLSPEKGGFLGEARYSITYDRGAMSGSGLSSSIYLSEKNIIAGDTYFGFHCYDMEGKFLYTIDKMNVSPFFDKRNNEVKLNLEDRGMKMLYGISVLKDYCTSLSIEKGKATLDFYNISSGKKYLSRPYVGPTQLFLLTPEVYAAYYYPILSETRRPIMLSFDIKGDTLCRFMNYNPLIEPKKKAYTNPDRGNFYYHNDQLTLRQGYNDTVYRLVSPLKLEPVYILNFGKQKLDIETALYGNKSEKLIPYTWLEAKDFIFLIYTQNNDTHNNRKAGTVKFNYRLYDKKENKLYTLGSQSLPEDFMLKNSIEGAIPLSGNNAHSTTDKLYAGYTKSQLENIINQPVFSGLSQSQQDKIKALHTDLAEGELLVMILE